MTADRISRLILLIIFGIIGWYVGTVIAGSSDLTLDTLKWTVPAMLVGAVIGALIAPYLTTRPARSVRRVVRQLPAQQIVAGTIGLVVGLVIAALLVLPLSRLPSPFGDVLPAIGAIVFGYLGITVMILRSEDITDLLGGRWRKQPAVKAESKSDEPIPVLLDSSVIIDGRIADISQTGFIMGPMLIPRFVLNEVQYIADSADSLRRNRGRRGLDMLNKLQRESAVPVVITDMDIKSVRQVDDKLVQLAKQLHCPIVTNDFNLNQVAQLQGVKVLNINALANAVKVLVLPGETIHVQVIDEGKEMGQGVGYLDDGTMVVVENGLRYINRAIDVQVTKVLQTNAGRMIFGQPMLDGSSPMTLQVYNTLTRRKEPFETIAPGTVRMYVCGPTVYDKAHVGHAMSAIVFDMVRRYLQYNGYDVFHVMNFTDVDDKIIKRSQETGDDPFAISQRYVDEFHRHIDELRVLPATIYPRVSDTIPEIVEMVQTLQESHHAYPTDGGVYFRVRQDDDYGKLSRRKLDDVLAGTRVEIGESKEDPNDFALWKAQKPGEPAWPSPWGPGRPGWHIECSAMALKHLGAQIDIHGGGNDLIFPHHENEIAQTESYTGQSFARYWMHNGMLQLSGEKMSKSLGNLVTIDEFLAEHEADVLRLLILSSHYRKPLAFNATVIEDNARALARLRSALRPAAGQTSSGAEADTLAAAAGLARAGYVESMDDDFNTAGALGYLFDLVTAINRARDAGLGGEPFAAAQATLLELTGVLGLQLETSEPQGAEAAPFIDLLLELRAKLRVVKQYALADEVRNRLTDLGVIVEDTREGSTWRMER